MGISGTPTSSHYPSTKNTNSSPFSVHSTGNSTSSSQSFGFREDVTMSTLPTISGASSFYSEAEPRGAQKVSLRRTCHPNMPPCERSHEGITAQMLNLLDIIWNSHTEDAIPKIACEQIAKMHALVKDSGRQHPIIVQAQLNFLNKVRAALKTHLKYCLDDVGCRHDQRCREIGSKLPESKGRGTLEESYHAARNRMGLPCREAVIELETLHPVEWSTTTGSESGSLADTLSMPFPSASTYWLDMTIDNGYKLNGDCEGEVTHCSYETREPITLWPPEYLHLVSWLCHKWRGQKLNWSFLSATQNRTEMRFLFRYWSNTALIAPFFAYCRLLCKWTHRDGACPQWKRYAQQWVFRESGLSPEKAYAAVFEIDSTHWNGMTGPPPYVEPEE